MDQLIAVVNELHDAFAEVKVNLKLDLPQIAVVGSQSSGKSSVLEAIVGKDFLPRGSGIVTRCPLVLQLVQLSKTNEEEWGEFLHKPGQRYPDFSNIHQEILSRTEEIAGKSAIKNTPINLKIYSRHVINLTLVDLPGLVTNAVGDQPKDIDRQIREMVKEYVSQENTIILAVSPANVDIATSASLQLAMKLDPKGLRTVGVLTKLDLMDRGTDATDVLTGRLVQLRHGFVGVVNRSQQDINDKKGMQASRSDEMTFLSQHAAYSTIAEQHGTEYLTKKLNQLLLEHIKNVIPGLKTSVENLISEEHTKMENLGMFSHDDIDASDNLLALIKLFSDAVNDSIEGCDLEEEEAKALFGGARLDYIFHDWFVNQLDDLRASDELTEEHMWISSRNIAGVHTTLFPSDKVFVCLSKKQIARLEEPSIKCVTKTRDELVKIVESCSAKLDRFPKLRHAVGDVCRDMLQDYSSKAQAHVRTIISSENSYVNSKHPRIEKMTLKVTKTAYDGLSQIKEAAKGSMENEGKEMPARNGNQRGFSANTNPWGVPNQNRHEDAQGKKPLPNKTPLSDKMTMVEENTLDVIRDMVEEYFAIVKENVADQIPKAIFFLIIAQLQKSVQTKLIKSLYGGKNVEDLMTERPEAAAERNAAKQMMAALRKAKEVLDNVQDWTLVEKKEKKK